MEHLPITPNPPIRQLLAHHEADGVRLTFQWPAGVQQVYIFRTEAGADLDLQAAWPARRLFTQQEYQRLGGYRQPCEVGIFTFYLFPFIQDSGPSMCRVQEDGGNVITVQTGRAVISHTLRQQRIPGCGKPHVLQVWASLPVPAGVVCVVKKGGGQEVRYKLDEPLDHEPATWHIHAEEGEYFEVALAEASLLYTLQ